LAQCFQNWNAPKDIVAFQWLELRIPECSVGAENDRSGSAERVIATTALEFHKYQIAIQGAHRLES
jgi:hypothetical protein